jgi:5,5'-dehydrodivanillate O-demethylase
VFDANGQWITSNVMNQDFLAWVGQGRIADRTQEHLGASDRGIVMMRRRFFEDLELVTAGEDPKGLIRDPARNVRVELPVANADTTLNGMTTEQIMKEPRRKVHLTSFPLQAGQPEHVRQLQSEAMGVEIGEFTGLPPIPAKPSTKLSPTQST